MEDPQPRPGGWGLHAALTITLTLLWVVSSFAFALASARNALHGQYGASILCFAASAFLIGLLTNHLAKQHIRRVANRYQAYDLPKT